MLFFRIEKVELAGVSSSVVPGVYFFNFTHRPEAVTLMILKLDR